MKKIQINERFFVLIKMSMVSGSYFLGYNLVVLTLVHLIIFEIFQISTCQISKQKQKYTPNIDAKTPKYRRFTPFHSKDKQQNFQNSEKIPIKHPKKSLKSQKIQNILKIHESPKKSKKSHIFHRNPKSRTPFSCCSPQIANPQISV